MKTEYFYEKEKKGHTKAQELMADTDIFRDSEMQW